MSDIVIEKIKARMAELGWSARDLEERSGVSFAYIYRLLAGNQSPTVHTLESLMEPLGLSIKVVKR